MEKGGSSMVAQGSALQTVAELSYKRFLTNEKDLRAVSGAVQNVQASVGETVELESMFDAPTLWSATAFVAEEVERMTGGLKTIEADIIPMKATMKILSGELARLVAAGEKPDKTMKLMKVLSAKMREAATIIVGLMTRVDELKFSVEAAAKKVNVAPERTSVMEERDVMDDLIDMFETSETIGAKTKGKIVTPEKGRQLISEGLEAKIKMMEAEIKTLTLEVMMLKAGSEDKSVKFAGLGWRSILDCQDWIKINFASNRYGLIMDPLLMLDRIFGSDDAEGDSQFKVLESRVKLKIATGSEVAVLKALYFKRPRLFHSGQESMATVGNSQGLEVWWGGCAEIHCETNELIADHDLARHFSRAGKGSQGSVARNHVLECVCDFLDSANCIRGREL